MTNLILNKKLITSNLRVASKMLDRMIGLISKKEIQGDEVLFIPNCNSIHTFFMKFTIDCVFVDKNKIIKSIHSNIKPWRLILPIWGAKSVFEMKAGQARIFNLKIGDQLDVGN